MRLTIENLRFSYGAAEVLHEISFSLEAGEFVSVLGPNGVGKSTLFRCILGLLYAFFPCRSSAERMQICLMHGRSESKEKPRSDDASGL